MNPFDLELDAETPKVPKFGAGVPDSPPCFGAVWEDEAALLENEDVDGPPNDLGLDSVENGCGLLELPCMPFDEAPPSELFEKGADGAPKTPPKDVF